MRFASSGSDLFVKGTLVLSGTVDSPAVLTSRNEEPPNQFNTAYQFNYVLVQDNGRIELRQAEIRYVGNIYSSQNRSLYLKNNATALIENSRRHVNGAGCLS